MLKLPEREPQRVYLERMVIMSLLLVPSAVLQGTRALLVAALSVLTCMITDGVWCLVRRLRYDIKDFAVPFWGLALALMMPVNISAGLVVLAGILCISVGKHLFGASDNIIFCPPAISAAFLIICYPSHMLYFPRYGEKVAAFGSYAGTLGRSIEYSLNLHSVPSQSIGDTLMGFVSGPIASVYVGIILVCGICMAFRRSNNGFVTLTCVLTAAGLAALFPRADFSAGESVIYELSSGYILFGTAFLAAEPHHAPKTTPGKIMYGFALGYTTMMFRFFGKTEGCFIFALLITNALSASFDRAVENFLYWKKTYLSTFENSKTQAQVGAPKLTDTQEILLPEKYRFNTPPIDGKITKKKRSKKSPEAAPEPPKLEDEDVKIAPDYERAYENSDDAPNYELLAKIENIQTIVDYDEQDILETGEDGISRIEQLRQQRQPGINHITEEENKDDE
ncbi:MAG: RnfABCDGE type electron transport complex subunit D [Oscillospiraceae bacterium]|nr:RnfABCDGE type electron transport complex subunit D [Oscillospiraceae bacterium]